MSFPASKSSEVKLRKVRALEIKAVKPQLTSLIDVMIVFIVFLIMNFSMEESAMNIPKDITLPISSARKPPKSMVVLALSRNYLVVDGEVLAPVEKMMQTQDLFIEPLYQWLEQRRSLTEAIARQSTKTQFKGEIAIEGDRKIPFALLQKIMFTCGRSGFNNFSLAVTQEQ